MKPYRDIADINLPGSYLFEALGMRAFGWGALGWRVYDLFLLLLTAIATRLITKHRPFFGTVFATSTFALIHIQDGIAQLGQRDLLIAVLILWSYAFLFQAQRRTQSGFFILIAALLIGVALTIKPIFLPLGVFLLLISAPQMRRSGLRLSLHFACGLAGLLLPSIFVIIWLHTQGILAAFFNVASTLIPLHAELGRRSFSYLLAHATSPIAPLCVLWLVLLFFLRPKLDLERLELLAGCGFAFLAYVAQGKGYPYHRYTLIALILILMGMDFVEGLDRDRISRGLSVIALAFGCFLFAPHAAWLSNSFLRSAPFEDSLTSRLTALGPQRTGQVQCLDTFGGCINTLYDMRIVQATGYLYDCYLFTPQQNAITARYREEFWSSYQAVRPKIIIVTDQFCFGNSEGFHKLDTWPALDQELRNNYVLSTEWRSEVPQRWWARSEMPPQYRIYLRK
ncbi:MAG TPA: hypothetical protein VNW54_14160 [Granulicella sp.]|nr:hypothetical protein [Granulicella sp.]